MVSYYGSSSAAGTSANPGDGPGSASPFSNHFAQAPSDRLLAYMESCHKGSWHTTLNNHAPTRPESYGGPTVPSVTKCTTFTRPGPASASWRCVLDLPNSFTKDDGRPWVITSYGAAGIGLDGTRTIYAKVRLSREGRVLQLQRCWERGNLVLFLLVRREATVSE